jgi:hypothetical protein
VLASNQGSDLGRFYGDGPVGIAVDTAHVYWLNGRGEVMRIAIGGGHVDTVARVPRGSTTLALDDLAVYFTGDDASVIYRAPKDRSALPLEVVPRSPAPPIMHILLAWDRIHWSPYAVSDDRKATVLACPKSGCVGKPKEVWTGEVPNGLAASGNFIFIAGTNFFGDNATGMAAAGYVVGLEHNTSGKCGIGEYCGNGQLPIDRSTFLGLATDETYVFLLAKNELIRTHLRGSIPAKVLASGPSVAMNPMGPALDADYVYWANFNTEDGSIARCSKKGCSEPEILARNQKLPKGVSVDDRAVYWITSDGNVMKLAKPEGPGQRPLK